jgi:hypothetical protein
MALAIAPTVMVPAVMTTLTLAIGWSAAIATAPASAGIVMAPDKNRNTKSIKKTKAQPKVRLFY